MEFPIFRCLDGSRWGRVGRWTIPVLGALSILMPPAAAQDFEKVKEGIAFVSLPFASGTAFCISANGYFVTNAHVLGELPIGSDVDLVLAASQPDEKTVKARLVRRDFDLDLAILQVPGARFPALPLGSSSALRETQNVVAIGYPFGQALAIQGQRYPEVTVSTGRITALRRNDQGLQAIQIDARLNPGQSGGPVLDEAGNVIGVIKEGVVGAAVHLAIPVDHVQSIFQAPDIELDYQKPISYEKRFDPTTFNLRVSYLDPRHPRVDGIRFALVGPESGTRTFDVEKRTDSRFRVTAPPLVPGKDMTDSRLTIEFAQVQGNLRSAMSVTAIDKPFRVGNNTVRLNQISRIDFTKSPPEVTNPRGRTLQGPITGLETVSIIAPGGAVEIQEVPEVTELTVKPLPPDLEPVQFVVLAGDLRLAGLVSIEPPPLSHVAPAFAQVPYLPQLSLPVLAQKKEIPLAESAVDMKVGGAGRYLVVRSESGRTISVVDLQAGEIKGTLPLPDDDALYAAGGDVVLIANVHDKTIETWSLDSLTKLRTGSQLVDGQLIELEMGPLARQLTVVYYKAKGNFPKYGLAYIDVLDNQVVASKDLRTGSDRSGLLAVSGDSRVCSRFSDHWTLLGRDITAHFTNMERSVPNYDGEILATSSGQRLVAKRLDQRDKLKNRPIDSPMIPTANPGIFLSMPVPSGPRAPAESGHYRLSIYGRDGEPLARTSVVLSELGEGSDSGESTSRSRTHAGGMDLPLDRRCHFVPQLGVIATLAGTNDRLVLRPLDLKKELKSNPSLPPVVLSPPFVQLSRDQELQHQIKAATGSNRSFKAELLSGPQGLAVSAKGHLRWKPPASAKGRYGAIISLADSEGNESLLRFEIEIINPS